jgi:hypothetical protein
LPGSRTDAVEPGQPGERRSRSIWFGCSACSRRCRSALGLRMAAKVRPYRRASRPQVTSATALRDVDTQIGFLASSRLWITSTRAVGGTLTDNFEDGQTFTKATCCS